MPNGFTDMWILRNKTDEQRGHKRPVRNQTLYFEHSGGYSRDMRGGGGGGTGAGHLS